MGTLSYLTHMLHSYSLNLTRFIVLHGINQNASHLFTSSQIRSVHYIILNAVKVQASVSLVLLLLQCYMQ